jgi:dTDP-4-dehydrorhamnose 3,5-epimerase
MHERVTKIASAASGSRRIIRGGKELIEIFNKTIFAQAAMDRAAVEIAPDRGLTMDLLTEISQPVSADDSIPRIDGKGTRMQLDVHSLAIPGVKLIRTPRFSDARGCFCETLQRADFAEQGLDYDLLQDNQSSSDRPGTVRGLHFQRPPFAQTKLVRVLRGCIFAVAVDLRRSSPSFGRHIAIELSSEGNERLLIPAGFAHGFCTLEPDTVVFYKVDQVYSAAHDGGVNWADSGLGIEWPVASAEAILSEKDRGLPMLADLAPVFE